MPRDGSGVYSTPSGTMAITNTPIPSTPYNTNVNDVAQDLNVPRPIVAGGTGANNARDAMTALGGEIANQVVTNYDTFPFVTGSFQSALGATNAPASGYFYGTAIIYDAGNTLLRATQMSGNGVAQQVTYLREKNNSVWGAWVAIASANDKVSKAGDTMTGGLVIGGTLNVAGSASFVGQVNITQAAALTSLTIAGNVNDIGVSLNNTGSGGHQWQLLSSGSGSGLGSGFRVFDATAAASHFGIDNSGTVTIGTLNAGATNISGSATVSGALNAGTANISGSATVSGALNASAGLTVTGSWTASPSYNIGANLFAFGSGTYHVINDPAGHNVLFLDGGGQNLYRSAAHNFYNQTGGASVLYASLDAGGLHVSGDFNAGNVTAAGILYSTGSSAGLSLASRGGGATMLLHNNSGQYNFFDATNGVNYAVLGSAGLTISAQGYKPGGGVWADSSDERIKDVLGDYEQGLAQILRLQPKRFKYKANDTGTPPPEESAAPYQNSFHYGVIDQEFVGLIAQDTEDAMPEMVSQREGYIDGQHVTDLRNIDTTPLIYALINAVKTLTARLDQLEADRA